MAHHGNLFHCRLHVLWHFDDSRQRRIARHDALEDVVENTLDLAIDQVVDLKLVKPVCLFQLPRTGTANNNLWLIFLQSQS